MSLINLIESDPGLLDLFTAQDYATCARLINEKIEIANPDPQLDVMPELSATDLFNLLSEDEVTAILQSGKFADWAAQAYPTLSADGKAKVKAITISVSRGTVSGEESFLKVIADIASRQDAATLQLVAEVLVELGTLSTETAQAIAVAMQAIPDPDYPPTVLGPSLGEQAGLGRVRPEDIQKLDVEGLWRY